MKRLDRAGYDGDQSSSAGSSNQREFKKPKVISGFAGDKSFVKNQEILAEAEMRSETLADILVSKTAHEAQRRQDAEKEEARKEASLKDIRKTFAELAKEERVKKEAGLIQNSSPESDGSK